MPSLRPHLGDHYINLKDPDATWRPRPIKPKEAFLPQLREKLEKEIASGRVYKLPKGPNYSACAMFMIPKPNNPGEARFLHDLVARNQHTILDIPNLPLQPQVLRAVAKKPFRSKIDLSKAYDWIRIFPGHEKYTTFYVENDFYRTRVLQQGDCNAPSTFQRIMRRLFEDEWGIFVYVYIDDIFIFSDSYEDHLKHVRQVLQKLKDNNFYASKSKSQFLPATLEILGHVITKQGIAPDPKKV